MPVNTATAAVHITPVVIKTFLEHYKKKTRRTIEHTTTDDIEHQEHAHDDLMFDEAFHIVKAFIDMGTRNSIESLQAFTNTHIPAPYWVAIAPVTIPFEACNRAADILIDWFGPDDLRKVVGGERWWQVRGINGLEGEWVTEKSFLCEPPRDQPGRSTNSLIALMDHLEPVMLYIHGGGYFFGSINTHRFQIIRYAKKLKGRAFAVNYRKAPQYPWPCPLQDVLAAYFYLINPPPNSPHKPIAPSKVVFAGDSAGGALCLTALTVLRDMGVPMPAGAVLISPWVDLTHSFASVMSNSETDITPSHGFVYKPSMAWPISPVADVHNPRVRDSQTNPPPQPGHADTPYSDLGHTSEYRELQTEARAHQGSTTGVPARSCVLQTKDGPEARGETKRNKLGSRSLSPDIHEPQLNGEEQDERERTFEHPGDEDVEDVETWEPKPPKVLMENPSATPLELLSQIQQYATNEQLTHPLVSPILQGSLCNLPPLYIIAGDGEALRDEIIYIAHRAAHPADYPVRKGVLKDGRRQRENVQRFTTPTKVHLQVFDDMPHVLTVFTFTESATYAYHSIAQFARHVTAHPPEYIARNPFPTSYRPECRFHMDQKLLQGDEDTTHGSYCCGCRRFPERDSRHRDLRENRNITSHSEGSERMTAAQLLDENTAGISHSRVGSVAQLHNSENCVPQIWPGSEEAPRVLMICERVDIHGQTRQMELPGHIAALQMQPNQIGIIKETAVRRWYAGQEAIDRESTKSARRIVKRRRKIEERVERMLEEARKNGLILVYEPGQQRDISSAFRGNGDEQSPHSRRGETASGPQSGSTQSSQPEQNKISRGASPKCEPPACTTSSGVHIDEHRRYGPLDLDGEHPPPTAIAGRRDTLESLALIKKHVYHTVPATHLTVPRMTAGSTIRAALDPWNRVSTEPKQSVSERQVRTSINPLHGLSIWNALLSCFARRAVSVATDVAGGSVRATRSHDHEQQS